MFGTRQSLSKFNTISLMYGNDKIKIVNELKYLGVFLDLYLSWNDDVDHLCFNISKRIGVIRRIK